MIAKRTLVLVSLMAAGGIIPYSQMHGQSTYSDVAVIVNVNSQSSQTIGAYFAQRRNIPAVNIIHVNGTTAEEVDSASFRVLRSQVESYLQANNLVNSINYLVTTKGVPLKVNRGDTLSTSSPSSSVESELSCILGTYASFIGKSGRVYSPYYSEAAHFTRAQYGIYLVTRLDGFSVQDVLEMIDRSGPNTRVSSSASFVLDQDPTWNQTAGILNENMSSTRTALELKGKVVELNTDSVYLTQRTGVLGYVSWGSNDRHADEFTAHAIPGNSWSPAGLAETYVSTSARSFDEPPAYGQSLVADLIQEGASGVKGYVYEPYSSSMADASILFGRYTGGYNLAESYAMASRYVSWMDVVVGDPKTSIQVVQGSLPVQISHFDAGYDGISARLTLQWGTLSETNNYGFMVQIADTARPVFADVAGSFVAGHGTTVAPQSYSWSSTTIPPGAYHVRLRQIDLDGSQHFSDSKLVAVSSLTSVQDGLPADQFTLAQNYPNPFNPATTISYSVPAAGHVRLTVFNAIGQFVGTLVDDLQSAGSHAVTFSPERSGIAASGTYFYRLQTGEQTETRKMLYAK